MEKFRRFHPTKTYWQRMLPASPKAAFFLPKPSKDRDKWSLLRAVAKDYPSSVQLRLEWLVFYETIGKKNALKTSFHFGISRKTFHKWQKRFEASGGKVESLRDYSKAPRRRRTWEVSLEQEERVVSLRRKYLKYGKRKLQVLYNQEYQETISTWKIERVIRKHQLFPDKETYQARLRRYSRARRHPRKRITEIPKPESFGHLWHMDAILIWWYGTRRVIFTAIEELTRIGFARVYATNQSSYAEDFLKRLMYLVEGKVGLMHSDNGSEFKGKFEEACQSLKIEQVYSRPRTPKDNPALERFNWTIQDEWLSLSETGLDDIPEANQDLTEWLVEYNYHRPHQSLAYRTPLEYAQTILKVLPMSPASTNIE